MAVDVPSLYVMLVLVASAIGLVCTGLGWRDRAHQVIRDWGLSTLVAASGLAVLVAAGGRGDPARAAAAVLLLSGVVLAHRSMRVYRGEPTADVPGWALVVVIGVTVVVARALAEGAAAAASALVSALVSAALGLGTGRIAWLLARRPRADARGAQRFTAVAYGLLAALFALRSAVLLTLDGAVPFSPMRGGAIDAVMIGGVAVLWVSAAMGVMWMVIGRQQAELVRLAAHDALTGALTRTAILPELEREVARATRAHGRFALVLFDLDHFKRVNDTRGHPFGDEVLRALVARLSRMVRRNDLLARYGGEEFLVLMPDADQDAALHVAERARSSIAAGGLALDDAPELTVSAGIAVYPEHGADAAELLESADDALYRSKRAGRNTTSVAEPRRAGAAGDVPHGVLSGATGIRPS